MASKPVDVFSANLDAASPRRQGREIVDRRQRAPRDCPGDFEDTFVILGRSPDGCEAHYHARRETITRWLAEQGMQRLIDARAAYVSEQRAKGEWMTRGTNLTALRKINVVSTRASIRDGRQVNDTIARDAAHFLRIRRYGGLIVSPAQDGHWWVGSCRLPAAQMVDLARSKGFDQPVADR